MDGWRPLRNGDQVFPSRRLMAIIDTSQMIVQADVGEIDIGHVRAGQPARVFPRAAPGLALRARVKSVSEVATSPPVWRSSRLPGKKVFRVVLTVLDARPELLRPEMTADFELIEATYPRSVLVPIEAVFPGPGVRGQAGTHAVGDGVRGERDASGAGLAGADGKGHSVRRAKTARVAEGSGEGVVYVLRDGRYWPRKVKLGTRNDNDFQVLKGLRKGETIAIEPPPASLIGPPPQRTSGQKLGGLPGALSSLLSWRPGA
jgi:multidrug efflux pump subunit AcrA (membrane-fusion protein)